MKNIRQKNIRVEKRHVLIDFFKAFSTGDMAPSLEEDYHRFFFSDLLRCFVETNGRVPTADLWITSRKEVLSAMREEALAETSALVNDASILSAGGRIGAGDARKQSETIRNVVKYLQVSCC